MYIRQFQIKEYKNEKIPKIKCTALYIWKSKEWKNCTCPKIVFIFGIIKAISKGKKNTARAQLF